MSDIIDINQIRDAYDTVPYDSHSFPATSPDHLEAVAHLFGLPAPRVATSRVLELGCASGGNILPLALRYPESHVVGIDLSPVQIAAGRRAAAELGLKNIELHQGDLGEIAPTLGVFDYIICHGVYSWVPPDVQEAILRVCRENLAPDGIAHVSYNCYPGWKAKEVIRDAMILRGRHAGSKDRPLAYARGMIDFLAGVTDPNSLMGRIVAEQSGTLNSFHESYLQHEFLELYNSPCYFGDFVAAAEKAGLAYLGDAEPSTMFVANFGASVAAPLLKECGDSQVRLEQYLDFVSNRTFRQTLLVHADRAGDISYRLDGERLRALHVAAFLPPRGDAVLDDAPRPYGPPGSRPLILPQRSLKAAAAALTAAWPGTLDFRSLMAAVEAALPEGMPAEAEAEVTDLIELLVMQDRGKVRLSPVAKPGPTLAVPEMWRRYAACMAEAGIARVTNAWHESIVLDVVERCLMPHLDGTQEDGELIDRLVECVATGDLSFRLADRMASDPGDIRRCAKEHLDRVKAQFSRRFVF
ncbi:methyltransferase regulatory domain-containing protein [Inquilinus limosus]|uniref:methyltransferase regulatory domain-containing protein n=1 Tax=Inquilinus limosus TaxID=171674 RepID=UPI00068A1BA9|nr:methyltransferase regulatory domain-containing protein [Inquilinus limosus]